MAYIKPKFVKTFTFTIIQYTFHSTAKCMEFPNFSSQFSTEATIILGINTVQRSGPPMPFQRFYTVSGYCKKTTKVLIIDMIIPYPTFLGQAVCYRLAIFCLHPDLPSCNFIVWRSLQTTKGFAYSTSSVILIDIHM